MKVTGKAGKHLTDMLAQSPVDTVYRVLRVQDGYELKLDKAGETDQQIGTKERVLLVLDKDVSEQLAEHTLDLVQTDSGPRLTIK